jgi:hypothetical protein
VTERQGGESVALTYGEFSMTDITDITTRRNFLTVAGGLAATIATSLAIAASPGACLAPDPIHAAIAIHQAAGQAFDTAHAHLVALLPDVSEAADNATQAALRAEIEAARAMIAVAPTTRAGLEAFAGYLAQPRQHHVWGYIDQRMTLDDGRTFVVHDASGTEKLIAQRAAELG